MRRTATTSVLLCLICGCRATPRAASPAEGTRPAEARQASRAVFDPQAAAAALEAWRNGPPWNGWEVLREAFSTGDHIDEEALRSPAFDKVLDAFDLEGESFAEFKHVLGEPDGEPDEIGWLVVNWRSGSARGSCSLFSWRGSLVWVLVKPGRPLHGKVLSVGKKENSVELSVGSDDGVAIGCRFTVYRGERYIGKVEAAEVLRDRSTARILGDWSKEDIAAEDDVVAVIREDSPPGAASRRRGRRRENM